MTKKILNSYMEYFFQHCSNYRSACDKSTALIAVLNACGEVDPDEYHSLFSSFPSESDWCECSMPLSFSEIFCANLVSDLLAIPQKASMLSEKCHSLIDCFFELGFLSTFEMERLNFFVDSTVRELSVFDRFFDEWTTD